MRRAGDRARRAAQTKLPSVPLGLLSYRTSFMSKYQALCYCSIAKPDPHTKSKTVVSHDRYGVVFMHAWTKCDGRY